MRSSFLKFTYFVFLLLVWGPSAEPRGLTDVHHTEWTSENGLGAVFDIQQSSDGFLWLTTSRGVLRFDGVRFQNVEEATHGAVHFNEIDCSTSSRSPDPRA